MYFHLEEHHSGRHLLQVLKENRFARQYIAPEKGIQKSRFFEDISSRGLEQMVELLGTLYMQAAKQVPKGKHFICRIKASTKRRELRKNDVQPDGIVFSDAVVLLGTPYVNQTEKEVRLAGYRAAIVDYWIATDRHDLSAEHIAFAYKLRWNIEIFFGWRKRHLNQISVPLR